MFIRFRGKAAKSDIRDLSDHELILKYRGTSDPEVIAILFQRYTHLVYGVCLKYLEDKDDAKDAVMEIFEGLMEDLLQHEIHNFKSWLHSVTRNHCLMKMRKERTVRADLESVEENNPADFVEIAAELHQEGEQGRFSPDDIGPVLETLSEPQRRCIELVYLKEKSYQEVCEITGYSMNEVKSHVQNGKRNLKIRLEANHVRKS